MAQWNGVDECIMSILFCETITVYNHYLVNREDCWKRTVLSGVQYSNRIRANTSNGKTSVTDGITVTIPSMDGYVPPSQFSGTGWTLNAASDMDVIVYGECPAEISSTYTLGDLKKQYGLCTIKSVTDARVRKLPIWKVYCE